MGSRSEKTAAAANATMTKERRLLYVTARRWDVAGTLRETRSSTGYGMDEEIAFIRSRELIITRAFEGACEDLGIGAGSLDVWRRERLTHRIEDRAAAGDVSLRTLQAQIVDRFLQDLAVSRETSPPVAPH